MNVLDRIEIDEAQLADTCRRYHVRELALFGSVLRNDFADDSDVDVLVEYDLDAGVSLFDHFHLQDELASILGRKVDLVSKRGLHWVIRDHVLESSWVIYAA
jgi:predicted nucleotidyltransferase